MDYQQDFSLCILCQQAKNESLVNPKFDEAINNFPGYLFIDEKLVNCKPEARTLNMQHLIQNVSITKFLIDNSARYHRTCYKKLDKLKGNENDSETFMPEGDIQLKLDRKKRSLDKSIVKSMSCFICDKTDQAENMHLVTTLKLQEKIKETALYLKDVSLLSKLAYGDLIANDAMYHSQCLTYLYKRSERLKNDTSVQCAQEERIRKEAFLEICCHLESFQESDCWSIGLSEVFDMFVNKIRDKGIMNPSNLHKSRFKIQLIESIPNLVENKAGRNIILCHKKSATEAIVDKHINANEDELILAKAASILREFMFIPCENKDVLKDETQTSSVHPKLLWFLSKLMDGNIKEDEAFTQPVLTIAQLIKFNSVRKRKMGGQNIRHSINQETPIAIYIGNLVHSDTRERMLVDKLHALGLCIGYKRVTDLSANIFNSLCETYNENNIVCPPYLPKNLFVTTAVDNIDHNMSSTTSYGSFHGTGITINIHRESEDGIANEKYHYKYINDKKTTLSPLPQEYSVVHPYYLPSSYKISLTKNLANSPKLAIKNSLADLSTWIKTVHATCVNGQEKEETNISWAAFHASKTIKDNVIPGETALLPLFNEKADSPHMVHHIFKVVTAATEFQNTGQTPVFNCDQPLFAVAKQIQWAEPKYGEDRMVIMFGPLHIEMNVYKCIGKLLSGSEWNDLISEANIATSGTAESFLHGKHVSKCRNAHQLTLATLSILMQQSFDKDRELDGCEQDYEKWQKLKYEKSPQFLYWKTIMDFEKTIFLFMRSIREADIDLYIEALEEMMPWWFAMDNYKYARWLSVHLLDMKQLKSLHPKVYEEFKKGKFVFHKTKSKFSAIGIDQNHEQQNAIIKGGGGAVGIFENESALSKWMVSGPEIVRRLLHFEESFWVEDNDEYGGHHEQTVACQQKFKENICNFLQVMEEHGNPFEEETSDLYSLVSKRIFDSESVTSIRNLYQKGKSQYEEFIKTRFIDGSTDFLVEIKRNNFPLLNPSVKKKPSGPIQKLKNLKNELVVFSDLLLAARSRYVDLHKFFEYENQPYPPCLSLNGLMRKNKKSEILSCIKTDGANQKFDKIRKVCTAFLIEGAVMVHILRPNNQKTFGEYAEMVFNKFVKDILSTYDRIDLVWDVYITPSIKDGTRTARGKGIRQKVVKNTTIPKNWENFLHVNENKAELFVFLARSLLENDVVSQSNTEVISTLNEFVISNKSTSTYNLEPCDHEESDSRLMVHVMDMVEHGHSNIEIKTVDSDVVVLAVSVFAMLKQQTKKIDEMWIAFGSKKDFRYIAIHEIVIRLGIEKSIALILFHALTGCDTTSALFGKGKAKFWDAWISFPELTDALLNIMRDQDCLESQFPVLEQFFMKAYDKSTLAKNINELRHDLYIIKKDLTLIPPTQDSLRQHILRSVFQGACIWGNATEKKIGNMKPTDFGWILVNESCYEPQWMTQSSMSTTNVSIMCKCKKRCAGRCSCCENGLKCTMLCGCGGKCFS